AATLTIPYVRSHVVTRDGVVIVGSQHVIISLYYTFRVGDHTLIDECDVTRFCLSGPESIEDTQKSFILLAVYLLKFQSQSTELFPGGGFAAIGFGIIRTQGVRCRPVNDGGQLEQITDRENLHTPERQGHA